jgi:hypothetical protein
MKPITFFCYKKEGIAHETNYLIKAKTWFSTILNL